METLKTSDVKNVHVIRAPPLVQRQQQVKIKKENYHKAKKVPSLRWLRPRFVGYTLGCHADPLPGPQHAEEALGQSVRQRTAWVELLAWLSLLVLGQQLALVALVY